MIFARCPNCDTRLEVDDEHLGQDVRCPSCRSVFAARPTDDLPAARRRRDDEDDDEEEYDRPRRRRRRTSDDVVDDARRAVLLPAWFSVGSGVLALVVHALDLAMMLANPAALQNNPLMKLGGGQAPPVEVIVAIKAFVFVYILVVIAGAFAMMRLKTRGFALTAMVMQVVPCFGICCVLSLPLGVWGLITLMQPDVRDGFELVAERPARDAGRGRDRDDDSEEDDRWRERD